MRKLADLTEAEWQSLCRRVGAGKGTQRDARCVEEVGMLPQAIRIRQGLATCSDAVLVHLQVQLRLLGVQREAA